MTALLEHQPEQLDANPFANAGSSPAEQPQNRQNPRHTTSSAMITVCLLIIAGGLYGRLCGVDQIPGVNGDEAWYGVQSQRFLDEYLFRKSLPATEHVNFRTPTGNVWNPFFMIPRLLLDATVAPSVWSLRLPAMVSGILTLLVNYWLCRRAHNRAVAWLTTALIAALPIAVVYSRLGWDACQSILFCLPLVYLPWISTREDWSAARTALYYCLALAAAWIVHPTNIFLVPLSAVLFWPRIAAAAKWELSLQSRIVAVLALVGLAVVLGLQRGAWQGVVWENLGSAFWQWAVDVAGLLNGAAVYGSISLPAAELPAARSWLGWLTFPTIVLLIWQRAAARTLLFPQQNTSYATLFDGTCLALVIFLGVAGPAAIQPGYERYGLWLIAPAALLIVWAYREISHRSRTAKTMVTILAIAQVALLFITYWHYFQRRFDVPATEQQLAHWTYRADEFDTWVELRQELEQRQGASIETLPKVILLAANDPQRWWFEWKWRYLAHDSGFEWRMIEHADKYKPAQHDAARYWFLHSQPLGSKEKISIRYLSN